LIFRAGPVLMSFLASGRIDTFSQPRNYAIESGLGS
jgi:hypothetical protein